MASRRRSLGARIQTRVDLARVSISSSETWALHGPSPSAFGLPGEPLAVGGGRAEDPGDPHVAHAEQGLEVEMGDEPAADQADPQGLARQARAARAHGASSPWIGSGCGATPSAFSITNRRVIRPPAGIAV